MSNRRRLHGNDRSGMSIEQIAFQVCNRLGIHEWDIFIPPPRPSPPSTLAGWQELFAEQGLVLHRDTEDQAHCFGKSCLPGEHPQPRWRCIAFSPGDAVPHPGLVEYIREMYPDGVPALDDPGFAAWQMSWHARKIDEDVDMALARQRPVSWLRELEEDINDVLGGRDPDSHGIPTGMDRQRMLAARDRLRSEITRRVRGS